MKIENLLSAASRLFFVGAFVLLVLAVSERIVNAFGYTMLRQYRGGRLLEFAAVLLLFVVAGQLIEIRQDLRKKSP